MTDTLSNPTTISTSPTHIIIFDFDYSLINVNSDTYVPETLAPSLESFIKEEIKLGTQWTLLMDKVVKKLYHEYRTTPDQINQCLASMPYFPEIDTIIRYAASFSSSASSASSESVVRTYIVSDANTVYIEQFLYGTGLYPCIHKIITNPAYYDNEGCLHILPYVSSEELPHKCPRCPVNLCKGRVLDQLELSKKTMDNDAQLTTYKDGQQAEEFENEIKRYDEEQKKKMDHKKNGSTVANDRSVSTDTVSSVNVTVTETITNTRTKETLSTLSSSTTATVLTRTHTSSSLPRIVYIGDGSGDLCPCMRLNENDVILARNTYPLLKKLQDPLIQPYISAKVVPWDNGKDIHDTIMKFLHNEI